MATEQAQISELQTVSKDMIGAIEMIQSYLPILTDTINRFQIDTEVLIQELQTDQMYEEAKRAIADNMIEYSFAVQLASQGQLTTYQSPNDTEDHPMTPTRRRTPRYSSQAFPKDPSVGHATGSCLRALQEEEPPHTFSLQTRQEEDPQNRRPQRVQQMIPNKAIKQMYIEVTR